MNLNLLKSSLLAVAICCGGGVSEALADNAKTIYARALTADDTYTAWSSADVATSGNNVWIGDFAYDAQYGLYGTGKNMSTCLTFDHTENSIQTVEFEWNTLNNTGTNSNGETGNYSYIKIGDAIEIQSDQQNQKGVVIINGESISINNCNQKDKNRNNDIWTVKAVINTATNTLKSFSLTGVPTNGKTATLTIEKETSLGSASVYNTITTGVVRVGGTLTLALKSIKISEEEQTVEAVSYTVSYKCGDTVVKTETGKTAKGGNISVETPITIDGQKYYAADGATTSFTVNSDNQTFEVALRKAAEYDYTVTSNLNTTIASGKSIEGDAVTVGYPRYINNNGTLYTKATTNSQYRISFTPDANNYSKTLEYTATQTNNVVYYSEAENIEGLTVNTSGNVAIRASNALAALANIDTIITTLPAGKYIIHAGVFSSANNPSYTIKFTAGSQTLSAPVTYINASEVALEEITLTEATDLKLLAEGMGNNCLLDYIYIVRTGEIAPVTDAKFATYSPSSNIKAGSNSNVKFYTAKIANNKIELTEVAENTVLKAGTGYVIAAETGNFELELTSEEGTEVQGNELLVAGANGVTATANTKYYVLTKRSSDNKVGFGKVKSGVKIPAGKCYIDASKSTATASTLAAEFLEITNVLTGIDAVDAEPEAVAGEADAYYTLQGVKLSQPVKGINIINGKKVLVK